MGNCVDQRPCKCLERRLSEEGEPYELDSGCFGIAYGAERDPSGVVDRPAIDTGRDRREGD